VDLDLALVAIIVIVVVKAGKGGGPREGERGDEDGVTTKAEVRKVTSESE